MRGLQGMGYLLRLDDRLSPVATMSSALKIVAQCTIPNIASMRRARNARALYFNPRYLSYTLLHLVSLDAQHFTYL